MGNTQTGEENRTVVPLPGELGYVKQRIPSKYDGKDKTLQFQIASDIHLEFYNLNQAEDNFQNIQDREDLFNQLLTVSAPYLALLGDIGLPADDTFGQIYSDLLLWCSQRWKEVWIIAGNHEYYRSSDIETENAIKAACTKAGENVFFMQKKTLIRDGVRVCGASLWSNIPGDEGSDVYDQIHMRLSDYKRITIQDGDETQLRGLEPKDTHKWHIDHVNWIKEQILMAKRENQPLVVLTHHAPSMNCSEPDIPASEGMSHAFCSELEELFEDPLVVWAFGHTHYPFNERYGTTQVVSNPVGYPFEYPEPYGKPYFSDFVLEA